MEAPIKGHVILAGAGPGDPDLITIKLQKALQAADIIISDRLVNPRIISENSRPGTPVVLAGKQGYNDYSFKQEEVTGLIIRHAQEGKTVLRLKGGDVAIFSNVLDELKALTENGLSYEIIPGITAASGASAYSGIPLTARDHSQGVQWLTFNPKNNYSPVKWKSLATSGDTLVFYMASKNLFSLADILIEYGCFPGTPLAVVEQATTAFQKVHTSNLQNCKSDFAEKIFSSPSLVFIGDVVNLYGSFRWFEAGETGSVFREIPSQKKTEQMNGLPDH